LKRKPGGAVSEAPITVEIEHRSLRAAAVFDIIRREGEKELVRRFPALWWSGVAAGLSIGFSVVAKAILAAHLAGRSLDTGDRQPRLFGRISHRHPRTSATLYREHTNRRPARHAAGQTGLVDHTCCGFG